MCVIWLSTMKINKGFFHYDHFWSYLRVFTFSHNVSLLPKSHTELVKLGSKKVRVKTKRKIQIIQIRDNEKRNKYE